MVRESLEVNVSCRSWCLPLGRQAVHIQRLRKHRTLKNSHRPPGQFDALEFALPEPAVYRGPGYSDLLTEPEPLSARFGRDRSTLDRDTVRIEWVDEQLR